MYQQKLSKEEIESWIQKTNSFEELTIPILNTIFTSGLKESEIKVLLKSIAKKTNVSMKDLRSDWLKSQQEVVDIDDHRSIALKVIQELGHENIIGSAEGVWLWNGQGMWLIADDRTIKKKIHDAIGSQKMTKFTVDSVLDLLKTEIYKSDHQFDINTRAINCLNGELHYIDGSWQLLPHKKENYRTTQIPIAYDPEASAPRFEQFLDEIFAEDPDAEEKKIIICEMLGYSLLTSCEFESFIILVGNGANGKSVLLYVVEQLVGSRNVAAVQPSQFDNRFQRAHLCGKLVNLVTEMAEGAEIADAQLKAIVSGETTTAEKKHQPPFDFNPFCTCWFGTNHMPHSRDFSDAIFRRAIVITFNKKFEGVSRDVNLKHKLAQELSGILNLALEGMIGVFEKGSFTYCPSSEEAKEKWRLDCDQVKQFIEECCHLSPISQVPSKDIFSCYVDWAKQMNIKKILGHNGLIIRLQRMGIERDRTSNTRLLKGIEVKRI